MTFLALMAQSPEGPFYNAFLRALLSRALNRLIGPYRYTGGQGAQGIASRHTLALLLIIDTDTLTCSHFTANEQTAEHAERYLARQFSGFVATLLCKRRCEPAMLVFAQCEVLGPGSEETTNSIRSKFGNI